MGETDASDRVHLPRIPLRMLVTGATGFLGRALLVRAAQSQAFSPIALARTLPEPREIGPGDWIRGDLTDPESVVREITAARPDIIVHTAYSKEPSDQRAVIVDGTRAIARAASNTGAVLIHLSTDLVFDGTGGSYTESDPACPILDYGRCKLASEEIALEVPSCAVLRPSLIYDPLEPAPSEGFVLNAVQAGRAPNLHGWEFRSPIYREDLVEAILRLARHNRTAASSDHGASSSHAASSGQSELTGRFHAGGSQRIDRYEFAVALAPYRNYSPEDLSRQDSPPDATPRPADCSLDSSRLETALSLRLRGVDEVTGKP